MVNILDVEIENFRSITMDDIQPKAAKLNLKDFNVIVGQNNSGKSNILRALNLFFNGKTDIGHFDSKVDFSMNPDLAGNSQTKITVTLQYSPSVDIKISKAVREISKETGIRPIEENKIRIRQMFSRKGTEQWRYIGSSGIKQIREELLQQLIEAIRTTVRFKYLPVGRDIDSVIQNELKTELVLTIFSGWRSATQKQKINSSIAELIDSLQPDLEKTSGEISAAARKVFKELKKLSLDLPFKDIDSLLPNLIPTANDGHSTSLKLKGAGIQTSSLLFYLKFLADNQPERKYSRPSYIWAIEEPESFLHPSRQREMFEVLKEFAAEVQTLITTHSPHFVPKGVEAKLFLAERKASHPFNTTVKEATFEEARQSLGVGMLDSMVMYPLNIVVEGPSDEIMLGDAWKKLFALKKIKWNPNDVKFFPAGNATAACNLYEGFKSYANDPNARVVLVIDGDDPGVKALNGLLERSKKNERILKANKDYFQLVNEMEWQISAFLMDKMHANFPSKILLTENADEEITYFKFQDGHKKEMAAKSIEYAGDDDLEDFEKLIEKIMQSA